MKSVFIIILLGLGSLTTSGEHRNHDHYLPEAVLWSLGDRYHHFDLIHSRRMHRRGRLTFDIVIQHRTGFARVTLGPRGGFYGHSYYDHYPLASHYCDEYCNFHYQHYDAGYYSDYDPYYGCNVHVNILVNRYPRYIYRPFYGYGSIYYHPVHRHYKRWKHAKYHGRGYYAHHKPYKHYQGRYKNHGHRGGNFKHGHGNQRHDHNRRRGHGNYRTPARGSSQYYTRPDHGTSERERNFSNQHGNRRDQLVQRNRQQVQRSRDNVQRNPQHNTRRVDDGRVRESRRSAHQPRTGQDLRLRDPKENTKEILRKRNQEHGGRVRPRL